MSKKLESNKKSAIILAIMAAACLVVPLSDLPKTFARYILGQSGTTTISVARPILAINVEEPVNATDETDSINTIDPENAINIDFEVTNFDSTSNMNEIELEYYLSFSNYGTDMTLPISYTLFDIDENSSLSLDSNNKTTSPKTASVFSASGESHHYRLTLTWTPTASKNYTYADLKNTLNIVADVKQKISGGNS